MANPVFLYTIQIIAILAMTMLAVGYFKSDPNASSSRIFALMIGCAILYIINGMTNSHIDPQFRLDLSQWNLLFNIALLAIPGLFMIYCFLVFQEQRRFPRILLNIFVFQILLEATLSLVGNEGVFALELLDSTLEFLQLIFIGYAIYWTLKGWSSDLVEDRRALRWMIIIVQGVLIFTVIIVENYFVGFGLIDEAQATLLLVSAIALLITAMVIATMQFDYVPLSNVIRKVSVLTEDDSKESYPEFGIEVFEREFRDAQLYREAGLTIASLAKKLQLPEYRLRAFIHKTLGYRNFNAMLHRYRIEDACSELASPEKKSVPVLTIALTVGYQSVTPFNNAFREIVGSTPSEYRKQKLNGN